MAGNDRAALALIGLGVFFIFLAAAFYAVYSSTYLNSLNAQNQIGEHYPVDVALILGIVFVVGGIVVYFLRRSILVRS